MIEIIYESTPSAKKNYNCHACYFLFEDDWWREKIKMTFSEYRAIIIAKRHKYKILKGERYIRQFNKKFGDTWTFRAIPAIHEICCKYKIYPEA